MWAGARGPHLSVQCIVSQCQWNVIFTGRVWLSCSWKLGKKLLADRSAGHEHQAAGNRIQRRAEVHYTRHGNCCYECQFLDRRCMIGLKFSGDWSTHHQYDCIASHFRLANKDVSTESCLSLARRHLPAIHVKSVITMSTSTLDAMAWQTSTCRNCIHAFIKFPCMHTGKWTASQYNRRASSKRADDKQNKSRVGGHTWHCWEEFCQ